MIDNLEKGYHVWGATHEVAVKATPQTKLASILRVALKNILRRYN